MYIDWLGDWREIGSKESRRCFLDLGMSDEDRVVSCSMVMAIMVCFLNVKGIFVPVLGMVSILEPSHPGYFNPSNQISKSMLTDWETSIAAAVLSITGQVLLGVQSRFC